MTRARPIALLVTAAACLALAGARQPALRELRAREGIALRSGSSVGLPPKVALLHAALGPFRGIATSYLWMRAIRLSDEGRHFEALQLAEAIGQLQPRLDDVWDFRAWELAYNVCAAVDDAPSRWLWIKNGIALLRDEAIPLNPDSILLHGSIAKIYEDRIGGPFDDFHREFKTQLAREVADAIGPSPDLAALAAAPRDAAALDPDAAKVVAEADAVLGSRGPFEKDADAKLAPLRARPAWPRAIAFLAARACRDKLKLEPADMLRIDREWGPLDWRWCDAHAFYWSMLGLELAEKHVDPEGERATRTMEGSALRALRGAMRRGRIVDLPDGIFFAPEPRLVARVDALYARTMDRIKETVRRGIDVPDAGISEDDLESRPGGDYLRIIRERRDETLAEGILLVAQFGRDDEGRRLHATLRSLKPDVDARYEDFVEKMFEREVFENSSAEEGGSQQRAQGLLTAAWTRYFIWLALGEDERARGTEALAERVQRSWQRSVARKVSEGDLLAAQRLSVKPEVAKREGLATAFHRISGSVRARLVERVGQDALDKALRPPEKGGGK